MKKFFRLFLLCTLILSTANAAGGKRASLVEVTKIKSGEVNPLQSFIGTVYYAKSSHLASKESGVVERVNIDEGDFVRSGDIIFILDSKVLDANIRQTRGSLKALEADLEKQTKEFGRISKLFEKRSISEQSFDNTKFALEKLKAQFASVKASLDSLLIQKSNRSIKAPYDGIITESLKEVGEWVSAGSSVAHIVDPREMEIKLNVPSRFITFLNDKSEIKTSIGNEDIKVAIKALIPKADIKTRTFPLTLKIIDTYALIEGMSAAVSVPSIKKSPALLVPRDAVIKKFGQEVIFLAKDGAAMMVPVKVIGFEGSSVAVTGQGLMAGADVIVKGNERIFPKSPIKVIGQ